MSLSLMLGNSLVSPSAATISADVLITHLSTLGSSTSYYNSVRTSAQSGNISGDGHLHYCQSLLGQSLGYVRDMSASAAQGAGQYNFGVLGETLANIILDDGLADRCFDAAQAAAEESGGYALVTAQIGPNDLANGNSAATILTRVATLVSKALARTRVILVLMQVPPRLNAAGEDLILVQRNLLNDGVVTAYGTGYPRVKVLECGDVGDDGSGYMQTNLVDTLNHPEPFVGATVGGMLYDLIGTNGWLTPDPLDLNTLRVSYGRNPNPSLTGNASSATSWATAVGGASTFASALSFEEYGDGTGRRKAIMHAAANGGNGFIRLQQSSGTPSSAINAGDIIEVFCEVWYESAGFAIGAVRLDMTTGGSSHSTECGNSRTTIESPPVTLPYGATKRILRTMPVTALAGITGVFANVRVFGSGTVKVGTPVVVVNRPSPDYSG